MMVKSILLDQNAKEWQLELENFVQVLSAIIDPKTQNIKLYYWWDERFDTRAFKIVDCGTNQFNSSVKYNYEYLTTLPQHEGNIVHHLFIGEFIEHHIE